MLPGKEPAVPVLSSEVNIVKMLCACIVLQSVIAVKNLCILVSQAVSNHQVIDLINQAILMKAGVIHSGSFKLCH